MYNNLKCVLNKIDDEMTCFGKRYQEEHKEITTEISDIIKNMITPIAEQNKVLRSDLQAASERMNS